MAKNILLIDNRVQSYETIVSSINNEKCISVVFDYSLDTVNDIKTKIINEVSSSNLDANSIRCVGLVQHNYVLPLYNLVQSTAGSVVTGVLDNDPALTTWSELRDFISWCKTTPEVNAQYFDMMACALYSDPDWKYVIDTLTTQTGVTVRASTDDTGAAALGGDWFLESHTGVNLKDVYFTESIENYNGLLLRLSMGMAKSESVQIVT